MVHAPYFAKYITLVPPGDIVDTLGAVNAETLALLHSVSEEKSLHRYAPGKWSMRESILHLTDAERVFAYRALRIARADTTPLPGFEENEWAPLSAADSRTWQSIVDEYVTVRQATIALFRNLPPDAWDRSGTASGNPVDVRAIAHIIAGHDLHHRALLRDRYLAA